MKPNYTVLLCTALLNVFIACKKSSPAETSDQNSNPPANSLPGSLQITGDPAAANGARWTYTETGAIQYQLEGILYKPSGTGPFPAVLINHGTGGSSLSYSSNIAKKMVQWGYVCIATNYTHAATSVPCGQPGSCDEAAGEWGASNSNLLRAMKCRQILCSLSYTDSSRLVSFGHSRGAFLTSFIAARYPLLFRAFAHTAGGVNTGTEPSAATVAGITRPYLLHHGDMDNVVPIERDISLRNILQSNGVIHSLITYPGYTHNDISLDSLMLQRTREWWEMYNR